MTGQPIIWKSETQVNTADAIAGAGGTNRPHNPQITALQDGGYLVVWVDESRTHYSTSAIVGQRYDMLGNKVGGEVDLSGPSEAAGVLAFGEPTVTTLDTGEIAVAFSVTESGGAKDIYYEIFSSTLA